jgi:NDP-sugar pyrophosphorylase family protein
MEIMDNPTLLILAAGVGSRYGSQKLIEPVGPGGETIVDYSIYDARRAGFGKIVFVIRLKAEQRVKELVAERYGKHLPVDYVFQELAKLPPKFHVPVGRTKPWGTTHAILMAAKTIHEPFAVINFGDFYGAENYRQMAHHLQSGTTDYAVGGYVLRNTLSDFGAVARGVCREDASGYLESIFELKGIERDGGHARNTDADGVETLLTGNEIVSMNLWGFTPQIFGQLSEYFQKFLERNDTDLDAECYIPSTVNEMLVDGQARVKVLHCADSWFGVTYREDHPRAVNSIRHLIEGGYYPKKLW